MYGSINEAMHPIVMCGLMYMYVVITEIRISISLYMHVHVQCKWFCSPCRCAFVCAFFVHVDIIFDLCIDEAVILCDALLSLQC